MGGEHHSRDEGLGEVQAAMFDEMPEVAIACDERHRVIDA
jgi:hypothetical protein